MTNNKLEEPDFEIDQDVTMLVEDDTVLKYVLEEETVKINIILLSYNRPRMLKEAIRSVLGQDYSNFDLYILDDGSDFDVWGLIDIFKDERLLLMQAPQISIEERLTQSRMAGNINSIIEQLDENDLVTYLCDDDLLAPNWLKKVAISAGKFPQYHVINGESWYFFDGQDHLRESFKGMPMAGNYVIPRLYWGTGSFVHKVTCVTEENIIWKDNKHIHSQDSNFIRDIWAAHKNYLIVPSPAFYRREHPGALSTRLGRKGLNGKYLPGFIPGAATASMIEGMME